MSRSLNSCRKGFEFGSFFQPLSKLGRAVQAAKSSRMKRPLLISSFLLILFLPAYSFGATVSAWQTGNWSDRATWIGAAKTGTITSTTTTTTVSGVGTAFLSELTVGDKIIVIVSNNYVSLGTIASIASNTSLTLTANATSAATLSVFYSNTSPPGSSDDVIIAKVNMILPVTVTVDTNASCNSLTFSQGNGGATFGIFTVSVSAGSFLTVSGTTDMLGINSSGAGNYLNISGTFTTDYLRMQGGGSGTRICELAIADGGVANVTGNIDLSADPDSKLIAVGTGRLNLAGNMRAKSSPAGFAIDHTINFASTSVFNFNGTVQQAIVPTADTIYGNVYFNNTSANGATLFAAITATNVIGDFKVQSGTFTNQGSATMTTLRAASSHYTIVGNASKTFEVDNGAVFKVAGTTSFPTGFGTVTFQPTSTADYIGTTQTISPKNYGNLTVSAGASAGRAVTLSSTGTIGVFTDFTPSSTNNVYTITSSTVAFNGNLAQTLPANFATYTNLTANNTSGSGITLGTNTTVNATMTFTSGTVTTSSNTLYSGSAGSVSRTSGHVVGNFKKFIATGATSKTFEVGDASNYTPVAVAFASVATAGDLTASVVSGDHANIGTSTINAARSVNRNWTLTNSGIAFTTYGATFTFVAGDVDGGASTAAFIVGKYSGGSWTYPTVGTKTATTTQATGLTAFSDFQIGEMASLVKTWDGGAATNNWGDAANWNTDGVPASTDDVDLTGANTININVAAVANNLTLNNANLVLTINSGNSLAVSGALTLTSGTFNMGTGIVSGAGSFTLSAGGNLGIGSTAGITSSGATGNVQVTGTRTFSTAGNYTYNGIAAQVTGNGLPATVNDLTINNGAGVSLTAAVLSLTGNLQLTNGTFNKGTGSTLNLAGNLVFNAGTTFQKGTGTTNFNGIAKTITDNTAALQDLGDVTVASSSSIALSTSARMTTLGGTGTITLNANTLTLLGSATVLSITTFNASTNSTTEFACAGNCEVPTIAYHHLTINSVGNTVTLNGTFGGTLINGNLLVQAGTFMRTGGSCGGFGCAVSIKGNITANAGTVLGGEIAQYEFAGTSQSINLATPSTQDLGQMVVGTASTNPTVTLSTDVYSAWGLVVGTTTAATGTLNLNGKTLRICCGNVLVNTGGTITPNNGTFDISGGFGPRTIADNTGTQDFGNVIVGLTGNTVNLATNIKAQAITVNGGTFNLGIYSLDVGTSTGTGSITGTGTLSASSPSVTVLRGTGNLGGGAFTFHALQLVGDGTTTTLTTNVTVNDNLTVGNGTNPATFDLGSFTANRASAGGTLTVANAATLKIGGTNTVPSNYSTHSIGATSTIEYSGTNQSLAVLNSAQDYGHLTISGSGTKTLAGNVNVAGTLLLTSGTVTTAANTLYVKATGTVSRVSGHVIGNFKKNIATGATSKTFEVGDASNYTPVTVAFASVTTAGDLTASVVSGDHSNIGTSTINATKSVNRNWTLTNSGIAFTTYDATFTFVAGDLDAGATTSAFIAGKFSSGSWTYPTVGTKTATTTQATGLTGFGDFQLGEDVPVPPNVPLVNSVAPSGSQPPGTELVYTVVFTNSGGQAAQNFIVVDPIPANTDFKLGSPSTVLGTTGLTVAVEFSNDNTATWTYTPVSGGGGALAGYDRTVTHVRWVFTGNLSQTSPNNAGSVTLTTRIQ
jgi:hypothetical protein